MQEVRAEQNAAPRPAHLRDRIDHAARGQQIEPGGGFIQHQDARIDEQRARQMDALGLTSGEGATALIKKGRQREAIAQFGDALGAGRLGQIVKGGGIAQHLAAAQARRIVGCQTQVAECAADRIASLAGIVTSHPHPALIRQEQPGNAAQQGALASTVGTEDSGDARINSDADAIQRLDRPALGIVKSLAHVFEDDHRHRVQGWCQTWQGRCPTHAQRRRYVTIMTEHLVANYARFPIRFVRGEGSWLIDEQGKRYLDCLAGIAVNALGHAHPRLTAAIAEQAGRLLHTSNLFHIGPQEDLAARLCAASFAERVYFCNSGAEANECAVKLARLWHSQVHGGRKPRLIAAEGAFHGRTIGALSITGTAAYRAPFAPLLAVDFVPFGDATALEAAMGDDVAAVFLEPVQGENGVIVPPPGYLAQARALCDRHQALLMLDEVQTGMGRCGRFLACEWEDLRPDVVSLAKGLGGGVPIGASLMSQTCADLLKPGTHASTFGGNHLACAAGLVVVDEVLTDGFLAAVETQGAALRAGLAQIFPNCAVRGRGLLCGVVLDRPPRDVIAACLDRGLVVGLAGSGVLRLAPPLTISSEEIALCLDKLADAMA